MNDVRFLLGDCRVRLRDLPAESVDCIVTSPPYFGLRQYSGSTREIGREDTMDGYLASLSEACGAMHRVLKPTGTLWLNLGDVYSNDRKWSYTPKTALQASCPASVEASRTRRHTGLQDKCLLLLGARLMLRLIDEGWTLRSEIVWAKPSPMPESVKDRPSRAHEKVYLLSKGHTYFYNRLTFPVADRRRGKGAGCALERPREAEKGLPPGQESFGARYSSGEHTERRMRDYEEAPPPVWRISTATFHGEHYATFPIELAGRCIESGCPPGGVVLDPFAGAGTTGLAAVLLGRRAVLCEISPTYIELAQQRIAMRDPDGRVVEIDERQHDMFGRE